MSGKSAAVAVWAFESLFEFSDLLIVEFSFCAEFNTIGFGTGDTVSGAFLDKVALKFTNGREHVKQQASRGAGCIDILVEDHQVDFLGFNLFCDIGEITHRARQPVEARHKKLVAFTDIGQCVCEFLTPYVTGT